MLHCWAWVGVCEKLLGLTPSGESVSNPRPKPVAKPKDGAKVKTATAHVTNGSMPKTPPPEDVDRPVASPPTNDITLPISPPDSGRSTPVSHPVSRPPRASTLTNLFKSFVVFTFSGLHHDWGSLVLMLDAAGRGETVQWRTLFSLSPFFILQPVALAFEVVVKRQWRAFKHSQGWPHAQLSTFERLVGFTWTWVWLGWSAGYFVQGMSTIGVWQHGPGKTFVSAVAWVWGASS